jgi:hypothetical protein
MVDVRMEKVYRVCWENESWLAKSRQDTHSHSPDKPSPSRHQPCIFYISSLPIKNFLKILPCKYTVKLQFRFYQVCSLEIMELLESVTLSNSIWKLNSPNPVEIL